MDKYIELLFVGVEFKDDGEIESMHVGREQDNGVIVLDNSFYGDIAKDLYKKLFPNGITKE